MRRYRWPSVVWCLVFWSAAVGAAAQPSPPRGTLLEWAAHMRRLVLDRTHGYGGRYYEGGLFRTFTRKMDYEYELDLLTYRFSLFDDARWVQRPGGYRVYTGSIDYGVFVTESQFKHTVALNRRSRFQLWGLQEENLRARRFFVEIGYTYQLAAQHQIGLRHTLGMDKADLDFSLHYQWRSLARGGVRLELGLLDWASNFVYRLIARSNRSFETRQRYQHRPYLLSITATTPVASPLRAELAAGLQTRARARVDQTVARTPGRAGYVTEQLRAFENQESVGYLGLLLEYAHPFFTLGVTYRGRYASVNRTPSADSTGCWEAARGLSRCWVPYPAHFQSREFSSALGLHGALRWRRLAVQTEWIRAINGDRMQGPALPEAFVVPYDFRERRLTGKTRLTYLSPGGFWAALELNLEDRNVRGPRQAGTINLSFRRNFPDQVVPFNRRVTLLLGYQRPTLELTVGVSFDQDGDLYSGWGIPSQWRDRPARFDGGFFRLQLTWP
ncbi:hypothetical protein [Rhodothermus profundi]|uniref:Capsule assembly protein Wzi n=1 Tax=Rhodothermus profundi TaxID=633813 RepID=A0A1M6VT22_9BACT|nr:hypothetical protein [Rhodothermus profundi]SHK84524.1 hypothetical protein SAMN04488087_2101 [Rhodothermus profundi]